jgi:hypothetical protein
MTTLYDRIAAFDRDVADRWKRQTKGDEKRKLKARDIDAIMAPLVGRGKTLTEKQADAIATFVRGMTIEQAEVPRIRARLRFYVAVAERRVALEWVPMLSDDLKPVFAALEGPALLHLFFRSPKSNVQYTPMDYLAVRKLIDDGKIMCAQVKLGGLSALAPLDGEYYSDSNLLLVYSGQTPTELADSIIHEVTHAIQDLKDARAIVTHFEADAFIAGLVATRLATNPADAPTDGIEGAAYRAAGFVIDGKTGPANKDWLAAYDAVVAEVNKSDAYKARSRVWMDKGQGEAESETALLAKTIADLEAHAKAVRDWAKEAADVMFVKPIRNAINPSS